jgi:predicted tellurium resistance membrane protein TerC
MTNGVPGAYIMITAVVISVLIMMQAVPVGFVNKTLRYKFYCLNLIGFMLLTESAHLSNALI